MQAQPLAQRAEEGANIFGQQFWLLQRGEMAAARHLRPVLDSVGALGPGPGNLPNQIFARKDRYPCGHLYSFAQMRRRSHILPALVGNKARVQRHRQRQRL